VTADDTDGAVGASAGEPAVNPAPPSPAAPSPAAARALDTLDALTESLVAGEVRDGQRTMAAAVADAIATGRNLVVEAGTGTGKSLAYLVPAVRSGKRTVVATATKALQDQLAGKDLPFLASHPDAPVEFAVLKGRSNYACRQRLRELARAGDDVQLALDGTVDRAPAAELAKLVEWASSSETGDRAELDVEPTAAAWAAVSVSAQECPGATRCPSGGTCFAEAARTRAAEADVVVVNQHLYGLHVASGAMLLPEHDVVIIDEAHQLEDVISATAGLDVASTRVVAVRRAAGSILEDPETLAPLDTIVADWERTLAADVGRRFPKGLDAAAADLVALAVGRIERVLAAVRAVDPGEHVDVATRRDRAVKLASSLLDDLRTLLAPPSETVLWIEGPTNRPSLRLAPLDVADILAEGAWENGVAILTSATVPPGLAATVGLPADETDELDVGSPFDYERHALLYCAADLPDPRNAAYADALHDELEALIVAAGGATLALFTSFRAMDAAVEELRTRLDVPVLSQRDRPKPALVAEFTADREACLFATLGFWQGVDVPGPTLSLVTIDRLPFPRPDEPLLQARREIHRQDAFRRVDLPRAATLLAQGAGRLVRRASDRGVVAVLDARLATSRNYRWDLIHALPPMRRTRSRAEAEQFLRDLRADPSTEVPTAAPLGAPA
jgi:ATP-dependent DNA helicase DinG